LQSNTNSKAQWQALTTAVSLLLAMSMLLVTNNDGPKFYACFLPSRNVM